MTRFFIFLSILAFTAGCASVFTANCDKPKSKKGNEYVVLVSRTVASDTAWNAVAQALRTKHNAALFVFEEAPRAALEYLRAERPRYVAIVEMPENLNRDYIIDAHRMSRELDDDIYADYLWGVISGYDAESAMRMVTNSVEPLVVKNAVATIMETNSAKWFDRYGYVDDHTAGLWGEKKGPGEPVVNGNIPREQVLRKFTDLYAAYDPDLVLTAAHATEKNLEMPFSLGDLRPRDGRLYADDHFTGEKWDLVGSGKRKVYFAIGNCLIGNFLNMRDCMAAAWINGENAAVMSGYVVTTWHGRNGWGGLKYWLTTPGRYTLPQAVYLNQQDLLYQLNEWAPDIIREKFDYDSNYFYAQSETIRKLAAAVGGNPTKDQLGFWHDRDVLAYYGDPKWDVRLQQIPEENDFTVSSRTQRNRVTITIQTKPNFSLERMAGDGFKEEHVLDLPFSYFFPERLENPRLAAGQSWKAAVSKDFLLIYDPGFEPGKTYTIVLETDK
ncbi:MAG: hypothetical protein FWE10_03035 [Rikenellaceae bacterium]|nr:hypothetical protein [Rikenellaceae bacterium]MCL2693135.1 hypothetical protein [Rikenellaceae bacterium]